MFYKPARLECTITTPFGIPFAILEARCLLAMKGDPEYEVLYNLQKIHWSERGKHFDIFFAISAKDHDVSQLEVNLLLNKYCNVRKEFREKF